MYFFQSVMADWVMPLLPTSEAPFVAQDGTEYLFRQSQTLRVICRSLGPRIGQLLPTCKFSRRQGICLGTHCCRSWPYLASGISICQDREMEVFGYTKSVETIDSDDRASVPLPCPSTPQLQLQPPSTVGNSSQHSIYELFRVDKQGHLLNLDSHGRLRSEWNGISQQCFCRAFFSWILWLGFCSCWVHHSRGVWSVASIISSNYGCSQAKAIERLYKLNPVELI